MTNNLEIYLRLRDSFGKKQSDEIVNAYEKLNKRDHCDLLDIVESNQDTPLDSNEPIKDIIFFGNLSCITKKKQVHDLLETCFLEMSGNQQPCHCSRENCPCTEQMKDSQKKMESCFKQIAIALGMTHLLK